MSLPMIEVARVLSGLSVSPEGIGVLVSSGTEARCSGAGDRCQRSRIYKSESLLVVSMRIQGGGRLGETGPSSRVLALPLTAA